MAAPAATARQSPAAGYIAIPDGFRTKVTLSLIPNLEIEEIEVKVLGFDNGEPVEQDSMWSEALRVVRARQITSTTPCVVIAKWDPIFLTRCVTYIGIEKVGASSQVITETFYDGSTRAYYGYLRSAEGENLAEGSKGRMTINLQPTNWDPVNRVYAAPVMVNVSGS